MTKLTLSADQQVIQTARRLSRRNRTSISAMFARMVLAADDQSHRQERLPPIVARASGIIQLPGPSRDDEVLAEALLDKYGLPK